MFQWLKQKDNGAISIVAIVFIFLILVFFAIILNLASFYIANTSLNDKIQRSVNSTVSFSMKDTYRADGVLILDKNVAAAKLKEYLKDDLDIDATGTHYSDDGKVSYVVTFDDTEITADAPSITVKGTVKYYTPLLIFGNAFSTTYSFNISSQDINIT